MKTIREPIAWNLVLRNLPEPEHLRARVRQKIATLETHLQYFPADAVHLHVALARHARKPLCTAALSLRLPSAILHSEKTHRDVSRAFDDAARTLRRELVALKSRLRGEHVWKRRERRARLRPTRAAAFATHPEAPGAGPQSMDDVVRALAERHYQRLLRHVRRLLWHDISAGELPERAIDPRGVVDDALAHALAAPERRPPRINHVLWLYALVRRELARRRRSWREEQANRVPLDAVAAPAAAGENDEADGYDAEQPLDIIERQVAPPAPEVGDMTPDPEAASPAETVSRQDFLSELRRLANHWPPDRREAFELHYVEGFAPHDIACIIGRPEAYVCALLENIQQRLRDEVRDQALL